MRELLADCSPTPSDTCALDQTGHGRFVVGTHDESWEAAAYLGIATAAAFAVYCTIECDSPYNYISGGSLAPAALMASVGILMTRPPHPQPLSLSPATR